jgi:hypothetical protein
MGLDRMDLTALAATRGIMVSPAMAGSLQAVPARGRAGGPPGPAGRGGSRLRGRRS